MFKERLATKILLPIFTVCMVFALFGVFFWGTLGFVFNNPKFIVKTMLTDKVSDKFYDTVVDDMDFDTDLYIPESLDMDQEELFEEIFDKDVVRFLAGETLEAVFTGDSDFDEDYIEDWIDDKDDIFDEYDISKSEMKEFKKEMIDQISTSLDEIAEESEEQRENFEDEFGIGFVGQVNAYLISCAVSIGVMLVILFLVARNKFLPIRNFGISLTISSGITLGIIGLFYALFMSMNPSDEMEEIVLEIFNGLFGKFMIIYAGLLLIGIALIVVGAILANKYLKAKRAKYDEDSEYFDNSDSSEFGMTN